MGLQTAASPQWPEQLYIHLLHLLGLPAGFPFNKGFHSSKEFENTPLALVGRVPEPGTEEVLGDHSPPAPCCPPGPGGRERAGCRLGEASAFVALVLHMPEQNRDSLHVCDACVCVWVPCLLVHV